MNVQLLRVRPLTGADYLVWFKAGEHRRFVLVDRDTLGDFYAFRRTVHQSCRLWVTHDCARCKRPREAREDWADEVSFAMSTKPAAM
jgi:hypothetical protein